MRLDKIKSFSLIGKKNTIDLEIDSEDHNFYCNDICVSNSHSVSYASLAALSVYLKFKYPLDFFLESLKMAREKQDVSAEINLIQSELQYFNVKLLPPDLVKSQLDFSKENGNLRFGLSAIKGISDKTVEALKGFLNSEKSNKFEVFQAAKKSGLSVGILSALIQSGCLQSLDANRPAAVFSAQLFNLLTDREKIWCLKYGHLYNYSIFDILNKSDEILDDKGKKLFKGSRIETIKKKADPYREIFKINNKYPTYAAYEYERRLLGFSYSAKLKDIFQEYSSFTLKQLINCDSLMEGENINVVGHVTEIEERISKNKKKYAKLSISDETGTRQIMLFDPKYSEFKSDDLIPKEDDVVILNLRKWNDALVINKLKLNQDKVYLKLAEMKE